MSVAFKDDLCLGNRLSKLRAPQEVPHALDSDLAYGSVRAGSVSGLWLDVQVSIQGPYEELGLIHTQQYLVGLALTPG